MPTFLQPDIHCEYLVEVILSQLSFKVVIGFLGRLIDIQKVVRLTCCRLVFLFNGFNVSKRSAQNKAKAKKPNSVCVMGLPDIKRLVDHIIRPARIVHFLTGSSIRRLPSHQCPRNVENLQESS
jgi:hypothetical protein